MHPLPRRKTLRRVLAGTVTAVTASIVLTAPTSPAQAGIKVTPGNFTGYGFDQCVAPSQSAMNAWMEHSPYAAVGIYTSGNSRGCRSQPNLTPTWVKNQQAKGWRLLPITLGPQAYCHPSFPRYKDDFTISPKKANNYKQARKQGRYQANLAVNAAKRLGINPKSTLWYDLEGFDINNAGCRESALRFLGAWTVRVHQHGYVSGVYSSAGSGIKMLDDVRVNRPKLIALPDQVWVADWDGKANVESKYIRSDGWKPFARMKQYRGGHIETWGGVSINIDNNFLNTGKGSAFPKSPKLCNRTVSVDAGSYPAIGPNKAPAGPVRILQCMLKQKNLYNGPLNGTYNPATIKAVQAYQAKKGIHVWKVWNRRAWTMIHAEGPSRTVKRGMVGPVVRRLQRALTAATNNSVPVTGVFNARTEAVTKTWQSSTKLPNSGVMNNAAWVRLKNGRLK